MGEPATWQRRVEEFVLGRIGDPPSRVLEVGCGDGELARALARAGHRVTAIDPQAPERAPDQDPGGPEFLRVGIEGFSDPGPFDRVVASLSLHHVGDLAGALAKISSLLGAGGELVVVEFAWERIDGATAEWALGRLPEAPTSGKPSWLERCRGGRAHDGQEGDHDHGDHSEAQFAGWAEEGFHDSRRICEELGRRFVERRFERVPYLYPDLRDDVSEADEIAAIEARTINAIGFRYVGTVA